MIRDLGTVRPGQTLYLPFHTFSSDDPTASMTMSGLAVTDIEVYKDGSTTQRASDNGYALLDTDGTDFDGTTGIHGISIDLADNSTAGFYAAGSQYWVVISSVTVDGATINFVLCTFRIGYPHALLNTTIASLSSQTSFTLTAGPAEDDALNGREIVIHDVASAVQLGTGVILDYTGSTKTVTLAAGVTFTAAATDNVAVMGMCPLMPTVQGRTLDVSTGGEAGVDWANVGSPTTTLNLSGTTISTAQKVDLETIKTQSVTCSGGVTVPAATLASTTNITAGTITTATNLTNAPTAGDFTATMKTSIGTAVAASAVASVTGNVGGNVTGTVGGFTTAAKAEIQTEAEDALVTHRLDELLNADSDIDGAAPPTVGSVFHELMTKATGSFTYDQTTDSLEALRDRGDAAWTTATGFSTHSAADVWAVTTRRVSDATNITSTGGTITVSSGSVSVYSHTTAALAQFFTADSGTTYASAVAGSVVAEIAENAVGSAGLDAAGVRAAVGLASADLDDQLDAINAKTTNLPASPAAVGSAMTLTSGERDSIADAFLDRTNGVETGLTPRGCFRLQSAAAAGKLSGAATTTVTIRNAVADSKARITATVDESGNRSAITWDAT